ncbi:hypothetical protein TorRG33x02_325430, partial [Trema orientale]
CIMLSLFLQAFLVLFGSMRQRYKNTLLLTLIWAAYLLADWVAAIAIGLITQSQGEEEAYEHPNSRGMFDQDLFSFWASFLLLHLGGPDAITSFALEDNEFWLRHLFGLLLQGLAAAYSFYLTLPRNKLWPPTLVVFLVGIIKYAERTRAFYLASLDHFGHTALPNPDPGPDYEEASTIYSSRLLQFSTEEEMTAMMPSRTGSTSYDPDFDFENITLQASDQIKLLRVAFKLFEKFKGLIVGFYLTTKDRESTRSLFLKLDHECAFRLIEYELSFMFQVLHTKVIVVRQKVGYILRGFSFSSLLGSCLYFFFVDKHGFGRFEIALTYALLIGAIVLDTISAIRVIVSDWSFVDPKNRWTKYVPATILKRNRWSRFVYQYNMIDYCLNEHPWVDKLAGYIHASDLLVKMKVMLFSTSSEVDGDLQKFIFDDLRKKSGDATTLREAMEACQQRGDAALAGYVTTAFASYIKLKWSISEFQYSESVLLWHIATEICCLDHQEPSKDDTERKCKILSDYMFYLLIMQPAMLSPVLGNWHLVFQDTCAEAKRFFNKYSISDHSEAIKKMNTVKTKFRPAAVKGIKSKSLFFDACILAQQLKRLEIDKWEVMGLVWVEFMSYAAINCRPIIHAQQPSKGGELLTFTWLLMNNLGLGMQFSEQQAGAKMVAVK